MEKRLPEPLGEHGLARVGALQHHRRRGPPPAITHLERQGIDLRLQLQERDEDLEAARTTDRELMARINLANPNR
ncbi:hypothetical protein ACFTY7_06645 [Streptomyces sp. NPDC057062]|uniref:hypothetical protein n=1 Tax=Streptomyces sp. NPDC057062 TaxID=3346011 RepID=UPI00363576BC